MTETLVLYFVQISSMWTREYGFINQFLFLKRSRNLILRKINGRPIIYNNLYNICFICLVIIECVTTVLCQCLFSANMWYHFL